MTARLVSAAVVALVVLSGCAGPVFDRAPAETTPVVQGEGVPATVTRVVDGDTVRVRYENGTHDVVRLLGVDAPEVRGGTDAADFEGVPDSRDGQACLLEWSRRASAFANETLDDEPVLLRVDPASDRRDRYGRLLAVVHHDGDSFNYRLVDRGYARVYDTRFAGRSAYLEAERRARAERRGLWACQTPGGDSPLTLADAVVDAPGDDNRALREEYVAFVNAGNETLDLSGWTVADAAGHRYRFPDGTTLDPGATVTLHTGSGADNATDRYWGASTAVWNNDGDVVTVRDDTGAVVLRRAV